MNESHDKCSTKPLWLDKSITLMYDLDIKACLTIHKGEPYVNRIKRRLH